MSRIRISESVQHGKIQSVHTYEGLENHHPSKAFNEPGRSYAVVDGDREEVLKEKTRDGNLLVSKDFILTDAGTGSSALYVPAPASGYIGAVDKNSGVVRIYDKPNGELIVQIRHMDLRNSDLKVGDVVEYGQPLGIQSGFGGGNPRRYGTHVHVDFNAQYLDQFKKYITDIDQGLITTTSYPAQNINLSRSPVIGATIAAPMAEGVLRQGERGPEVTALQTHLNTLGFKDAQGKALVPDADFGNSTKQAVAAFQRARGLVDDGIVGNDTFAALRQAALVTQATVPGTTTPVVQQLAGSTTSLSNLIGSGEGGYNSYNRGVAGDSRTPINLSDMTIAEIMRRQDLPRNDPDRLFAVGKFQIIPGTMEATVNNLGLNGTERFTPALQERMFADYLVDEKRPSVKAYITGQGNGQDGLGRAQLALAQEFASVADPRTGRSYYDGDSGGNHSSITTAQVETALNQMRTQYRTNIDNGLSPDAAYRALNGQGQNQVPAASQNNVLLQSGALADGVLKHGERGTEVSKVQEQLNALGFKDAQGKALVPDGDFGDRTKQAVQAFQRARGLVDDGVVGKDTFAALKKSEPTAAVAPTSPPVVAAKMDQSPLLSNPNHPDHALYKQALVGLEKLPASTFKNEQERQNAAASVAFEAKVTGLTKIDNVALSTNGSGLFAVQGAMNDPAHQRIYVDKAQAAAQPIEKSTQQMQQDSLLPTQLSQAQEQQKKTVVM